MGSLGMFYGASGFNRDLSSWNISSVTNMKGMLDNSGLSTLNYDLLLEGWSVQVVQPNVPFGVANLTYCTSAAARQLLINEGWVFTGDFESCSQTISFQPLVDKQMGDDSFELGATASSGLEVIYSSSNTNVATVSDNVVTIVGVGTTTITASQPGDTNYTAATSVDQDLVVNKGDQIITFGTLPTKTVGDSDFVLAATGGGTGIPVTYSSSDEAVATVSGAIVTIVGGGTTTITASQQGNTNYYAAISVDQLLTVTKLGQTITFGALPAKNVGDPDFQLSASGGASGNPVTFSSSDGSVATISGNTVSIVGEGSTTITAIQAGNSSYDAADPVSQTLTVGGIVKSDQVITFNSLIDKTIGEAPFELTATGGGSGNPVTFTSSDITVATISGNTATLVGAGTATITANQVGNENYNAAIPVNQELTVNKKEQTITFDAIDDQELRLENITLNATASSGLEVTYEIVDGPASVSGSVVTFTGLGTVSVKSIQSGNGTYEAASEVIQTFDIITITGLSRQPDNRYYFYPNPTSDHITIKSGTKIIQVEIRDLNGKRMDVTIFGRKVDISTLKSGNYLLKVVTRNKVYVDYLVKQR